MKISTSPTREKFPLSTNKVIKKTISGTIVWFVLFAVIGGSLFMGSVAAEGQDGGLFGVLALGVFIFLLLIILLVWLYQRWYYAVYFYDLTDRYIVIRKGPITPTEITIPYERIQDVYVDQDLLDRFFGLYDVHLASATASSGIEAHIDGVEKAAADGLRALLLDTVMERIGKKTPAHMPPVQV